MGVTAAMCHAGVSVLLHVNIFFPLFGVAQTPVSLVYRNPPVLVRLGAGKCCRHFSQWPVPQARGISSAFGAALSLGSLGFRNQEAIRGSA